MAKKDTIYFLDFDSGSGSDQVEDMTLAVKGLQEAVKGLGLQMQNVFVPSSVDMKAFVRQMENGLLSLRLNLGKLKSALAEAVAPVAAMVLPALNSLVRKAVDTVQALGLVLGALFGAEQGTESMADSTKKLNTQLSGTAKAARRTLAGFDRINRLGAASGSSAGTVRAPAVSQPEQLSPRLQAMAEKILELLEPIRRIDFGPLQESLRRLGGTFSSFAGAVGSQMEWLWFQVLSPLAKWVIEAAGPASVELLRAAFEAMGRALMPVMEGLQRLMTHLQPVVSFIGSSMVGSLELLRQQFEKVGQTFADRGRQIQEIFDGIGQIISAVWARLEPVLARIRQGWSATLDVMGTQFSDAVRVLTDHFLSLTEFVSGVLTGRWSQAWNGLTGVFKGIANSLIGLLNGLLAGVTLGVNGVIRSLNRLSFSFPDWNIFGELAGKRFGLELSTVTAPRIPYLAKGAVLPANRPFLAMVGDQRHGTNVEAPLSTIQEAVALVMEDVAASNLAGQEAIVAQLRQILEAVLGIRIGDDVIGSAAERYQQKMAVIRGGYL